ncbi:MAG: cation-translocating P-type ATPase [Verrucomicrobiales bacterium]|nr:cation-translocating P-type ATPase [Verrucomicrobiales bacterium]
MQVTSLLSQSQGAPTDTGSSRGAIATALLGVALVANAYALDWTWSRSSEVAGFSAMLGAALLGLPLLLNSVRSLRRGEVGINELVSLAILASFATGDYRTSGLVAFFMFLGELIETRTAAGARAAIESLLRLAPTQARRLREDGTEEEVPTSRLQVGDVLRIRPGDNIPADGVIRSGQGSINQAHVTGESLPVDRGSGDEVYAGSSNLTGVLEVRVTRAGEDTTLGRVRDLILAAEKTRLPISRIIDEYAGYYTPLVLAIGALVWVFTHDLNRVISVLVVSCPCAFVLATPTAMVAALAAASRLGILVKNVADLEMAGRLNAFVFDKTGTVTTGRLAVTRLGPAVGTTPAELLRFAACAEKYSTHPAAKALLQLAEEAGLKVPDPADFAETAGRGVRARVDGRDVYVGRANWLSANGVAGDVAGSADLSETEGYSLVFVAVDGRCVGWVAFQDRVRSEARSAVAALRALGVRSVALVSGDREVVAKRVAAEIGIERVSAECLPQDKVSFVHEARSKGYRVAVVGDGVNDAPALAAGDIGIAMGAAGSEVAIQSARIALMNSDLGRLPFLVNLSRSARRTINQNFVVGLFFILGGLTLAALGRLNPIAAAILHNLGSLLVVFNSARLVREGEETGLGSEVPDAAVAAPANIGSRVYAPS